ncbi:MAG: MFS transporter [Fibrobacteria bacterium]|nr:MFS transporter [Fibrobacteria bacterium]
MNSPLTISISKSEQRAILVVGCLTSFLTPFLSAALNVALPAIGADLGIDAIMLNWVATSFLLSAAVFLVPFGKAADIYGRKRFLAGGLVIYTLASLVAALAQNAVILILGRVLQGVGSALMFATGMALVLSVFPPKERGKVLGITVTAVYLGLSLGPFIGGLLTGLLGWRSVFWINIPLGTGALLYLLLKVKGEWSTAVGEKLDVAGSVVYGVSLTALMFGFSRLNGSFGIAAFVGGGVGLLFFIRMQIKSEHPVLSLGLFFQNRVFGFSMVAALVNYSATFSVGFLMSLYLQYNKGLSPTISGFVMVSQPLIMAAFSPMAGRMSDKIIPGRVAAVGMAFTGFGLVMSVFLREQTSLIYVIACLVVQGIGFALFSSPNANAAMGSVEKRSYGVASGILGTTRLLGQMFSMGMVMMIFSMLIGKVSIGPEQFPMFLKSAQLSFGIFAVLCFLGIFASLVRNKEE